MRKIFFFLTALLTAMVIVPTLANDIPRGAFFWATEGLGVLAIGFLIYFYRRVVRPLHLIGNGMELLREQDFSSRLHTVGETEADRIVDVFNRMLTEMREGRIRLLEQNRLLDLLVEASPMGVVLLDFDGHITSLNPAAKELLECNDNGIGKTFAELPGNLARHINSMEDGTEETFHLNDAHIYRCTRQSFLDRGFRCPFVLIESLTRDVMQAERKAYGKVIRIISHEVNNTMASVNSILEMVGEELGSLPDTHEMLATLRACAARSSEMTAFITRFADVVKIPEPILMPTPLHTLLTANERFLESLCNARGISLHTVFAEPSCMVKMDVALMAQVLVNMVKNSVESIIVAGREAGIITIEISNTPAQLVVSDNGRGISAEVEKHLFTPFFSTKPNGHGIGLLLIREILTRHGFRFSLKTDSDGLTKFTVVF